MNQVQQCRPQRAGSKSAKGKSASPRTGTAKTKIVTRAKGPGKPKARLSASTSQLVLADVKPAASKRPRPATDAPTHKLQPRVDTYPAVAGVIPALVATPVTATSPTLPLIPRSSPAMALRGLHLAPGLASFVESSSGLMKRVYAVEQEVVITVATKTVSGERIQSQRGLLAQRNLGDFRPKGEAQDAARQYLAALGFRILRVGRFGMTVAGPARLVSDVLGVPLSIQARPRRSYIRATENFAANLRSPRPEDLFVAPMESLTVKANTMPDCIDDFVFTPPPHFFSVPNGAPPVPAYHAVDSLQLRTLLNVPSTFDGTGVTIAMVDSGFFDHPYYRSNHFDLRPFPTTSGPTPQLDSYGHGTAIAYNIFAIAPKATVLGLQQTDPPQDSMEDAADANVDIITCSWGWDYEQSFPILEATIRDIVREGKIVLFASGNGHQAWPGSMPEVLSIGGVFWNEQHQFEASNYASGFMSSLYPPRRVPDVSGLCGQKPKGIYIMMPCPPGSEMDKEQAGVPFPDGDETTDSDGWVGASGTSSATPQIAGVCALMVQKARTLNKSLTTGAIRDVLQNTATPVETGTNAQGFPAVGTPNIAVGFGLVNAEAALAKI